LDTWSADQVEHLQLGGNQAFHEYLSTLGLEMESISDKYDTPRVIYYTEILKAKVEDRMPAEYDEASWKALIGASLSSSKSPVSSSSVKQQVVWVSDKLASGCMVCWKAFSLFKRRHHCRRCGKVCCAECAPADNCRPILEWGIREPVRHCKSCYRSPIVTWKDGML
jgi:hypothetical protein